NRTLSAAVTAATDTTGSHGSSMPPTKLMIGTPSATAAAVRRRVSDNQTLIAVTSECSRASTPLAPARSVGRPVVGKPSARTPAEQQGSCHGTRLLLP